MPYFETLAESKRYTYRGYEVMGNQTINLETVRKLFGKTSGVIYVTRDGIGGFIVYIEADSIRAEVERKAGSLPFNFTISTVSEDSEE